MRGEDNGTSSSVPAVAESEAGTGQAVAEEDASAAGWREQPLRDSAGSPLGLHITTEPGEGGIRHGIPLREVRTESGDLLPDAVVDYRPGEGVLRVTVPGLGISEVDFDLQTGQQVESTATPAAAQETKSGTDTTGSGTAPAAATTTAAAEPGSGTAKARAVESRIPVEGSESAGRRRIAVAEDTGPRRLAVAEGAGEGSGYVRRSGGPRPVTATGPATGPGTGPGSGSRGEEAAGGARLESAPAREAARADGQRPAGGTATTPGTVEGSATAPGTGTTPATTPGTTPATTLATTPATAPGTAAVPGTATTPGTTPATAPGTAAVPGTATTPGTTPDAAGGSAAAPGSAVPGTATTPGTTPDAAGGSAAAPGSAVPGTATTPGTTPDAAGGSAAAPGSGAAPGTTPDTPDTAAKEHRPTPQEDEATLQTILNLPQPPAAFDSSQLPDPSPQALLPEGEFPATPDTAVTTIADLRPQIQRNITELSNIAQRAQLAEAGWQPQADTAREAARSGNGGQIARQLAELRTAVEHGLLERRLADFRSHVAHGVSRLEELGIRPEDWNSQVAAVEQAAGTGDAVLTDSLLRQYTAFVERHLPLEILTGENAPRSFDSEVEQLRRELTAVSDPAERQRLQQELAAQQELREKLDRLSGSASGSGSDAESSLLRRRALAQEEAARSAQEVAQARQTWQEAQWESEMRRRLGEVREGTARAELERAFEALREEAAPDERGQELRQRLEDAASSQEREQALGELAEHNQRTSSELQQQKNNLLFEALRAKDAPDERGQELWQRLEDAAGPAQARQAFQELKEHQDRRRQEFLEQQHAAEDARLQAQNAELRRRIDALDDAGSQDPREVELRGLLQQAASEAERARALSELAVHKQAQLQRRLDEAAGGPERERALEELARFNNWTAAERRLAWLRTGWRLDSAPQALGGLGSVQEADARYAELLRQVEEARTPQQARLAEQALDEHMERRRRELEQRLVQRQQQRQAEQQEQQQQEQGEGAARGGADGQGAPAGGDPLPAKPLSPLERALEQFAALRGEDRQPDPAEAALVRRIETASSQEQAHRARQELNEYLAGRTQQERAQEQLRLEQLRNQEQEVAFLREELTRQQRTGAVQEAARVQQRLEEAQQRLAGLRTVDENTAALRRELERKVEAGELGPDKPGPGAGAGGRLDRLVGEGLAWRAEQEAERSREQLRALRREGTEGGEGGEGRQGLEGETPSREAGEGSLDEDGSLDEGSLDELEALRELEALPGVPAARTEGQPDVPATGAEDTASPGESSLDEDGSLDELDALRELEALPGVPAARTEGQPDVPATGAEDTASAGEWSLGEQEAGKDLPSAPLSPLARFGDVAAGPGAAKTPPQPGSSPDRQAPAEPGSEIAQLQPERSRSAAGPDDLALPQAPSAASRAERAASPERVPRVEDLESTIAALKAEEQAAAEQAAAEQAAAEQAAAEQAAAEQAAAEQAAAEQAAAEQTVAEQTAVGAEPGDGTPQRLPAEQPAEQAGETAATPGEQVAQADTPPTAPQDTDRPAATPPATEAVEQPVRDAAQDTEAMEQPVHAAAQDTEVAEQPVRAAAQDTKVAEQPAREGTQDALGDALVPADAADALVPAGGPTDTGERTDAGKRTDAGEAAQEGLWEVAARFGLDEAGARALWEAAASITQQHNPFPLTINEQASSLLQRDPEQFGHILRVAQELHAHGGPDRGRAHGVEAAQDLARQRGLHSTHGPQGPRGGLVGGARTSESEAGPSTQPGTDRSATDGSATSRGVHWAMYRDAYALEDQELVAEAPAELIAEAPAEAEADRSERNVPPSELHPRAREQRRDASGQLWRDAREALQSHLEGRPAERDADFTVTELLGGGHVVVANPSASQSSNESGDRSARWPSERQGNEQANNLVGRAASWPGERQADESASQWASQSDNELVGRSASWPGERQADEPALRIAFDDRQQWTSWEYLLTNAPSTMPGLRAVGERTWGPDGEERITYRLTSDDPEAAEALHLEDREDGGYTLRETETGIRHIYSSGGEPLYREFPLESSGHHYVRIAAQNPDDLRVVRDTDPVGAPAHAGFGPVQRLGEHEVVVSPVDARTPPVDAASTSTGSLPMPRVVADTRDGRIYEEVRRASGEGPAVYWKLDHITGRAVPLDADGQEVRYKDGASRTLRTMADDLELVFWDGNNNLVPDPTVPNSLDEWASAAGSDDPVSEQGNGAGLRGSEPTALPLTGLTAKGLELPLSEMRLHTERRADGTVTRTLMGGGVATRFAFESVRPVPEELAERLPDGFTVTEVVGGRTFHFDASGVLRFRGTPQGEGSLYREAGEADEAAYADDIRHISFGRSSSRLSDRQLKVISDLAAATARKGLEAHAEERSLPKVTISGHSNGTSQWRSGSDRALSVSEERAKAVAEVFKARLRAYLSALLRGSAAGPRAEDFSVDVDPRGRDYPLGTGPQDGTAVRRRAVITVSPPGPLPLHRVPLYSIPEGAEGAEGLLGEGTPLSGAGLVGELAGARVRLMQGPVRLGVVDREGVLLRGYTVTSRQEGGFTVAGGAGGALHFSEEGQFQFRTVALPGSDRQLLFPTPAGVDGGVRLVNAEGTTLAEAVERLPDGFTLTDPSTGRSWNLDSDGHVLPEMAEQASSRGRTDFPRRTATASMPPPTRRASPTRRAPPTRSFPWRKPPMRSPPRRKPPTRSPPRCELPMRSFPRRRLPTSSPPLRRLPMWRSPRWLRRRSSTVRRRRRWRWRSRPRRRGRLGRGCGTSRGRGGSGRCGRFRRTCRCVPRRSGCGRCRLRWSNSWRPWECRRFRRFWTVPGRGRRTGW